MESSKHISCPNCGTTIDLQNILAHQLEEEQSDNLLKRILPNRNKNSHDQADTI
jgi:hypothetical protein